MRKAHSHPAAELLESVRRAPAKSGTYRKQGWTARWTTSTDKGFRSVNISAPSMDGRYGIEASMAIVRATGLRPNIPPHAGLLTYIISYPKAFEEFTESDEAGEPRRVRVPKGMSTADYEDFCEVGLL